MRILPSVVLRILATFVALCPLAGCFETMPVDLARPTRPQMTRMIVGLDASTHPIEVGLEFEDGSPTCAHLVQVQSPKGSTGVTYAAFDVEPGTYSVSFFGTAGGYRASDPAAFTLKPGEIDYIGTFGWDATVVPIVFGDPPGGVKLGRDLAAARTETQIGDLKLAPATSGSKPQASAMCQL